MTTDDKFYDAFRREILYQLRSDHPERLGDYLKKRHQENIGKFLPVDVASFAARYFLDCASSARDLPPSVAPATPLRPLT